MPVDRWSGGDDYEAYVGRWSRLVAREFLAWLSIPSGRRWVDVGCGTGALSSAILDGAAPASVVGIDPSADFVGLARRRVPDSRARFLVGSGERLPLDDGSADAIVSGLVLNFIPDPHGALREMIRVAATGATVAGYLWDYAEGMEMIRRFWDAAIALDADATAKDEAIRFPICAPGPLRQVFEGAGLTDIDVRPIDIPTVFAYFDDYWTPFLSGVAPAPGYVAGLDETSRATLRERLRTTLPTGPDGSIHLTARAFAVRGRRP
jgi:SAM-dependent methyltransferase